VRLTDESGNQETAKLLAEVAEVIDGHRDSPAHA
jgi:hypothetical protein